MFREAAEIGPDLFQQACKFGLEGLVSKRRNRAYRDGRSTHWIKARNRSHRAMNRAKDAFSKVLIYVNTSKEVDDIDHLKVFANEEAMEKWFAENDPEGVAITIPLIPRCARVVRSSALAIRELPYIDAARACGFGHTRIILRHMVPNVLAPFLIMLTAFVGQAILAEASLSYLGLGVQEPTAAWGLMLQGGAEEYASTAPWIAVFPGLAIALTAFGFSLFGDALRDALDPKLRDR